MRQRFLLSNLVIILAALAVGLAGTLFFTMRHQPRNANVPAEQEQTVTKEQQDFQQLALLSTDNGIENSILLYGGSLIASGNGLIREQLKTDGSTSVDLREIPEASSRQAVSDMATLLRNPPKLAVLDVGRFDAISGVSFNETVDNLSLILEKANEAGSAVVLLTGVGSNGDVRFGPALVASLPSGTHVVDATQLLMTSATRISPVELNETGKTKLIALLQQTLKSIGL